MQSTEIGLVTLAATQGFTIFTTLMPNRANLYACDPHDTGMKQNVRHGELVASVLVLGFSGLLTYFAKNNLPLKMACATIITMIAAYEYTLKMNPV